MQPLQSIHGHAIKVINRSRRNHDLNRHATIRRLFRRASGFYFHVVIPARFVICLEAPWNILYAQVSVRLLQQINDLSPKRLRTINSLSGECDVTERILAPFVNRNDNVDLRALSLEFVTRWIDYHIHKSFGDIKALYQLRSLVHIGGHEGQCLLQARVALARRSHQVLEEFVRRLSCISVKHDLTQHESWTFGYVQTQPAP